jgi:hypothetical protein
MVSMQKKKKKDGGGSLPPGARKAIVGMVDSRVSRVAARSEDFKALVEVVRKLGESTDARLERLAAAQERTEARLEQLAAAQHGTENELRKLAELVGEHTLQIKDLNKRVGGISRSMGYALENEAYRAMPALLKQRLGIELKERLLRQMIVLGDGSSAEINIIGRGSMAGGKDVLVIGEAKTRAEDADVEELVEKSAKIPAGAGVERRLVLVTHFCDPGVVEHARGRGVEVFFTYEFQTEGSRG